MEDQINGRPPMQWTRIRIPVVAKGVLFEAMPHFKPKSKPNCPPALGFYIEDDAGQVYTGYLRGVNEKDLRLDFTFKLIIRGVSTTVLRDGTIQIFLEERVIKGDRICVQFTDQHKRDNNRLVGQFNRYLVFVGKAHPDKRLMIEEGDFVIGNVQWVTGNHQFIDLIPQRKVTEDVYNRRRGQIFRANGD